MVLTHPEMLTCLGDLHPETKQEDAGGLSLSLISWESVFSPSHPRQGECGARDIGKGFVLKPTSQML